MPKEAIQVMYFDYKTELLGGNKPRIKVTLHKNDRPREYFLIELPAGSPVTGIKVSTDSLSEADQGKLTIQIGVYAKATPQVLAGAGRSRMNKDEIFSICNLSSLHHENTAVCFFQACENVLQSGGTIPITVLNSQGKVLCVLQATKAERFIWKEMMKEMEAMRNTATNPQTLN